VAFDTKYRPRTYDDVLGQDAAVAVLRQFVKEGRGFHQSYVFCGQHGSGKTTLGRILARALLCEDSSEGNPCDQCHSCTALLAGDTTECFEELDAATKSGKADVLRITEEIAYSTFSGKRAVYLFDEAHRLSKQALDAMLKPMEDCVRTSEDKQLVCIFCTTEPEKMRGTIFSRCAPAFSIRSVKPTKIAERLAQICDAEGVPYEEDALISAAEICERHIRDAMKTVEGVSMLGGVTMDNLSRYLGLGANDHVLDILDGIGDDLPAAQVAVEKLSAEVAPAAAYERISDAALTAYRTHLGVGGIPHRWKEDRIRSLAAMGDLLIGIAGSFSNPPHRPSRHTLTLDVAMAHHTSMGTSPVPVIAASAPKDGDRAHHERSTVGTVDQKRGVVGAKVTPTGVWLDPRAIGGGSGRGVPENPQCVAPAPQAPPNGALPVHVFRSVLRSHLRNLNGIAGPTRRPDVGGS
jgi:DNA polymerase III subunit gamma/tau